MFQYAESLVVGCDPPSCCLLRGFLQQETLEQARQDTQLYTTPAAHTFEVLKDALNDQGRLTRPAMHRCLRQLRAMVHNQARHRENEKVKGAKGAVSEHTYSSAAAENVMNRLFDAVDVGNVGDVNFCEFASALSVSWRHCVNMH